MSDSSTQIVLGVITGAHGIRGAVKVKAFTEELDGVTAYGALSDSAGREYKLKITGEAKGQLICTVNGLTDRNDAELLKGTELLVPRDRLPDTDDGSYYINDLIDLSVVLEDGTTYGTVKSVQNYGAGDLLDIATPEQKQTETVIFNNATFSKVDVAAGKITYHPPEIIEAKDEKTDEQ